MKNDAIGNVLIYDKDLAIPGQYEPDGNTLRLGSGAFRLGENKGLTFMHEMGHSWGLEHDYEMGIQMPVNDLLGQYAKTGGMMTSANSRSILNEEISWGIKPIVKAALSVNRNNVNINIIVGKKTKYEIR